MRKSWRRTIAHFEIERGEERLADCHNMPGAMRLASAFRIVCAACFITGDAENDIGVGHLREECVMTSVILPARLPRIAEARSAKTRIAFMPRNDAKSRRMSRPSRRSSHALPKVIEARTCLVWHSPRCRETRRQAGRKSHLVSTGHLVGDDADGRIEAYSAAGDA